MTSCLALVLLEASTERLVFEILHSLDDPCFEPLALLR